MNKHKVIAHIESVLLSPKELGIQEFAVDAGRLWLAPIVNAKKVYHDSVMPGIPQVSIIINVAQRYGSFKEEEYGGQTIYTCPLKENSPFSQVQDVIRNTFEPVTAALKEGRIVMVHCESALVRSPTILYLLLHLLRNRNACGTFAAAKPTFKPWSWIATL